MAVIQANQVLEDQSQIESGPFGTFVGVYDGHGGPDVARYVCDNLYRHFQGLLLDYSILYMLFVHMNETLFFALMFIQQIQPKVMVL